MKICVSSKGSTNESIMDPRFGRAEYFVIVDTDIMKFNIIDNGASKAAGGAGITSGQMMIDNDVKAVITGNVGPNAMNVLKAANIEIYRGLKVSVKENINKFKEGVLEKIDTSVESHHGMNL